MRDELGVSYFPCSIQQKYNVCSLSYRKYIFAEKVNQTRALKLRFHEKIITNSGNKGCLISDDIFDFGPIFIKMYQNPILNFSTKS